MTDEQQELAAVVPAPLETGVAGTQRPGTNAAVEPAVSPFEQLPVVRAIGGLAAQHPRAFGPETQSSLVIGIVQQLEFDLRQCKEELRRARQELEAVKDELSDLRVENARLGENYHNEVGARNRKNIAIALGTAAFTLGLGLLDKPNIGYGLGLLAAGTLLVLTNWLPWRKGGRK